MNTVKVDSKPMTPSKIVCVGRNYLEHIQELGNETPDSLVIFTKPNSSISTRLRANVGEGLHYEGEISFVAKDARLHALGFGLDLTRREFHPNISQMCSRPCLFFDSSGDFLQSIGSIGPMLLRKIS